MAIANLAKDDLVLDFFAGSGTTGIAVLELNVAEKTQRRFIVVQLPESTGHAQLPRMTDVMEERLKQAAARMSPKAEAGVDTGFRVFALAQSNFTEWDASLDRNAEALKEQLELHVDHIRQGRTDDDILYELLLKSGFPLTTPVEKKKVAGKTVYAVADGALIICLDRALTLEVIRGIADLKPERVVCLDEGFAGNDQLKTNAVQTFRTKGVTSFKTA
jgi:adenine-specific DNA-methyltransferase